MIQFIERDVALANARIAEVDDEKPVIPNLS